MRKSRHLLVRAGAVTALLAFLISPFSHVAAPAQATITFTPSADAYVSSAYPGTNYGTTTTLRVDGSPDVHSYLRFSVSGLSGSVISQASLQIYANSASSAGLTADKVADNSWGESTITYSNMPALGSALSTSPAVTAGTWVSMD